jgi:hypothetical protein
VRKAVQVCYCRGMPKVFSPLQYRRDRAVIAFKESVLTGPLIDSADAAIRTATRVRITAYIVEAVWRETPARVLEQPDELKPLLKAAFEAAGFEVVD